ncbi:FAD-binding oxidoreductase [Patulibacter sp. S7RM1-6]
MSTVSAPTSPDTAGALQALRDALGAERVLTGADELARHGRDESFHAPHAPDAVVVPRSTEEVALVVRTCRAHRVPVIPFGAGTSLEGHVAALHGGVSVDMSAMDRVLRVSTEDLDVTVQPGITRRALDARLRPEGVFFPVDPGADATIGGMIATAASGTTTVRYGAMRENVLSLVVVTGTGEIVRTRSRARKSAAGYDLTRLFVGSEGTLGIVCEATLRIQATPEATSTAVCGFATLDAAVACVVDIGRAGIPVTRIELVDARAMEALRRRDGLEHPAVPTIFLEFDGSASGVAEQAEEAAELAREHGATRVDWTTDEAERRRLWRARHGAYEASRALRPGSNGLLTDACVPVSRLAECIAATTADVDESGLVATIVGHVGDGNFHVIVLVDPDDAEEIARAQAFHDRLAARAIGMEGTCTGEHGVGYGKARFLEAELGAGTVALLRAVKDALDPDGILNPGKVLPPLEAPAA